MTDVEAYERAQTAFGSDGSAWRAAPERVMVGRWISIESGCEPDNIVLRTKRHALLVLGEGKDWNAAFAAVGRGLP